MVIISDSSFADYGSNYTETHFNTGNGGTQTPVSQASGGNPGGYLNISNSVGAAPSGSTQSITNIFMIKNGATYTPSVSGAITSIDFSISLIKLAGSSGLIVNASPGLVQDGIFYFWTAGLQTGSSSWTSLSITNLHASDFVRATNGSSYFDSSSHPNFTNGSTIQFGISYPTGGAPGSAAFTTTAGFDNWVTTVNTVPEASTALLGAIGVFGLCASRRRSGV
ncbi:MAG TPA: PEP-CTERM sorting domain-containing protein [Haloferula sp.]